MSGLDQQSLARFQFLYGTIKSQVGRCFLITHLSFNSSMVQLKDY